MSTVGGAFVAKLPHLLVEHRASFSRWQLHLQSRSEQVSMGFLSVVSSTTIFPWAFFGASSDVIAGDETRSVTSHFVGCDTNP